MIVWLKLEVEIELSMVIVLDNINWLGRSWFFFGFWLFFLLIEVFGVDWFLVVDIVGDVGKVIFDEVYFLFIISWLMNIDLFVKNIFNNRIKEVRLFFIIKFCKKDLLGCMFWVMFLDILICCVVLFLLFFWDGIVLLEFLFIFLFIMVKDSDIFMDCIKL